MFLGTPRKKLHEDKDIEKPQRIWPMYLIVLLIMVIGLFPLVFNSYLLNIISQYQPGLDPQVKVQFGETLTQLSVVGWYSLGFVFMILAFYYLKILITRRRVTDQETTWGCAYTGEASKLQYTASSFIRSYRKLAEPVLSIQKEKVEATGLYPENIMQKTHARDKIETWLIDKPLLLIRKFLSSFVFLQNGNIQAYILYGFIFVGLALLLPSLIERLVVIFKFLNQL